MLPSGHVDTLAIHARNRRFVHALRESIFLAGRTSEAEHRRTVWKGQQERGR